MHSMCDRDTDRILPSVLYALLLFVSRRHFFSPLFQLQGQDIISTFKYRADRRPDHFVFLVCKDGNLGFAMSTPFKVLLFVCCAFGGNCSPATSAPPRYEPNWDSLDSRPLPQWFDDAKIGIFLHWGVFSVPSFTEWFWWKWKNDKNPDIMKFMNDNFPPGFSYQEFAPHFKAELFNPDHWGDVFASSGAKYVVLTSKHHEGYTLWPSNTSYSWNSVEVGPHKDLVGEVAAAVRKQGITFGLYHSKYEWFNPLYLRDKANNWQTHDFVTQKTLPELYEIVNRYKPDVIWSDGDWEVKDDYWQSLSFLTWLYNDSPVKDTVVTNDRWGQGNYCKHGDFINCADHYRPGKTQHKKWENCMTLDKTSWGYVRRSTLGEYLTDRELLQEVVETIAYGGNILINVGPTADGRIEVIFEERLRKLGSWLKVNGEAIYKTSVWQTAQNDSSTPNVYYTSSRDNQTVYSIFFDWPQDDKLHLFSVQDKPNSKVTLLKNNQELPTSIGEKKELVVDLTRVSRFDSQDVAFVLKIQGL